MNREWKSGERVPALTRGLRKRSNCRENKRFVCIGGKLESGGGERKGPARFMKSGPFIPFRKYAHRQLNG